MSLTRFALSVFRKYAQQHRWRVIFLTFMVLQANVIIMGTLHLYRYRDQGSTAGNISTSLETTLPSVVGGGGVRQYGDRDITKALQTLNKTVLADLKGLAVSSDWRTKSSSPLSSLSFHHTLIASAQSTVTEKKGGRKAEKRPLSLSTHADFANTTVTAPTTHTHTPTKTTGVRNVAGCAKNVALFLNDYRRTCERIMQPRHAADRRSSGNSTSLPVCACVPPSLKGTVDVTYAKPQIGEMELQHPELEKGGRWRPSDCIARQKVAFIVPFRDREEHLRIFLNHIHPILQRQQLDYTLFVVEQKTSSVFNKAMLMNIGFTEALKLYAFDCFIFHDVDMLPEDDRNMYTCSSTPRHAAPYLRKWKYKLPYNGLFGGAIALTPHHFRMVNGFSNKFVGWGGEDDDMFKRVQAGRLRVSRYPPCVARYTMIRHKHDRGNPYNRNSGKAWLYRPAEYRRDGLNSLRYREVEIEQRPLYTWLYASVEQPARFAWYVSNASEGLPLMSVISMSAFLTNTVLWWKWLFW